MVGRVVGTLVGCVVGRLGGRVGRNSYLTSGRENNLGRGETQASMPTSD